MLPARIPVRLSNLEYRTERKPGLDLRLMWDLSLRINKEFQTRKQTDLKMENL